MDYEKKYKEAQKWIESIYSELSHEQQMEAEAFFPELKESEDEKMMHQLHSWMKEFGGAEEYTEKVYTWLKSLLEKQGEQKHTDEIEPKFHEGEWITNGDYTWKIVEVKPLDYILQSQEGNIVDDTISHVDEQFHSFTIKDAKDGDVLACPLPKGCESGEQIFIFKEINSRDYVENCIEYYCRVCEGEFYENENDYMGTTSSPLYPATNEQRDTLMKAMADAGYTFDFEKKELKTVEQNPAWSEEGMNKPNGGIVMEDFNDGNGFYKVNLAYLNEEQVEQIEELVKRWGLQPKRDEDESIISDLLDYFDEDKCLKHEVNDIIKWLKTIKPQQKGWGENEIKMLDNLITYLDGRKDLLEEIKSTYIGWLKSLKERYIWKPSDEQMDALAWALSLVKNCGEENVFDLRTLYEQLKKLKGE